MAGNNGLTMTVKIDDKRVRAAFNKLSQKMANTTPIMKQIGLGISSNVRGRIGSGALEPRWQPLNPVYRKAKRNKRMMQESGHLRESITYQAHSDHVFIGTNRQYAAIQQFGGKIYPKRSRHLKFKMGANGGFRTMQAVTIPARPFLTIEAEDQALISDIVFDEIKKMTLIS